MNYITNLAKILDTDEEMLIELEEKMFSTTGKKGILEKVSDENEKRSLDFFKNLGVERDFDKITAALREKIYLHERQLLGYLDTVRRKYIRKISSAFKRYS